MDGWMDARDRLELVLQPFQQQRPRMRCAVSLPQLHANFLAVMFRQEPAQVRQRLTSMDQRTIQRLAFLAMNFNQHRVRYIETVARFSG